MAGCLQCRDGVSFFAAVALAGRPRTGTGAVSHARRRVCQHARKAERLISIYCVPVEAGKQAITTGRKAAAVQAACDNRPTEVAIRRGSDAGAVVWSTANRYIQHTSSACRVRRVSSSERGTNHSVTHVAGHRAGLSGPQNAVRRTVAPTAEFWCPDFSARSLDLTVVTTVASVAVTDLRRNPMICNCTVVYACAVQAAVLIGRTAPMVPRDALTVRAHPEPRQMMASIFHRRASHRIRHRPCEAGRLGSGDDVSHVARKVAGFSVPQAPRKT